MAGILVFAENRGLTRELLNAGKEPAAWLGTGLAAIAFGEEDAQEYIRCGAQEVFLLQEPAQDQVLESYVPVIAEAAKACDPDVFLVSATGRGKEIGARLAARLKTGLCSCCTGFGFDEEKKLLKMERMVYGGAGIQTVMCTARPQMATIAPRSFEAAPALDGNEGRITRIDTAPQSPLKVTGRAPKQVGAVDVTEAKILVCVGRGVEKEEDIDLARQLARVLGAEVACSRPIAEELHWLPEDVYLGISGKKVKPELYIGLGVSGQIQHVTGIRDSKVIFAVNRDENAPIFDAADYGIVGDLYRVVPALIEELKAASKN
jgi:electron transfer flavoprotein alpha subunit